MTGADATLCPPTRFFRTWFHDALKRYNCGRRFGHFPVKDSFGYPACSRCRAPLL